MSDSIPSTSPLRFLVAALMATSLILIATVRDNRKPTLSVIGERGEMVVKLPLGERDILWMGFTHSSEHVRVASVLRVIGAKLRPAETRMEGYGPGLSQHAGLAGGNRLRTNEGRSLQDIVLLVTPSTAHWLAVGGKKWDLSTRVPRGRSAYRFTLRLEPPGWEAYGSLFLPHRFRQPSPFRISDPA